MLQEMRLAAKLHRQPGVDQPFLTSHGSLAMATTNAARPTGFHQEIGALEKGYRADMVLLDLKSIEEPYFDPDIDPVDALLYRGKAGQVDTVIIDGETVLRGGKPTKVDKEEIVKELKERFAAPLDPQTRQTRALAGELLPYVKKFYQTWRPNEGPPHYRFNSRR
jgi:cytosine/adenosine deaminase-related metal-dependent hydrolase